MRGKIVVIEGTDRSGKDTQAKLLEQNLNELGKKCIMFSFPMYDTPTGKIVGGSYLGKKELMDSFFPEGAENVDPHIASLYYAADRKYNMEKINQYLDEGYYVILDRYTTSNLAYQGSKIENQDDRFQMYQWIDKLEYWLLGLQKPDKTIFLHVPYEYNLKVKTNLNEMNNQEMICHLKQAEESYIELSQLYNWDTIECVEFSSIKSIEQINQEIIEIIKELF